VPSTIFLSSAFSLEQAEPQLCGDSRAVQVEKIETPPSTILVDLPLSSFCSTEGKIGGAIGSWDDDLSRRRTAEAPP